jgi:putative intracellular protease/amidase
MSKILFALTSHAELGDTGRRTGFYVSEAAHPHAVVTTAGHEVDFVSVRGGAPRADGVDPDDSVHTAFLKDHADALANTPAAADVNAARYSAILFVGGHGTMWDFRGQPDLQRIAREIYEGGGVVAAVCHGPAALVDVTLSDGSYLVAGKNVAALQRRASRRPRGRSAVPPGLDARLAGRAARASSRLPGQRAGRRSPDHRPKPGIGGRRRRGAGQRAGVDERPCAHHLVLRR